MTTSRSPILALWLMAMLTAACNNNTPSVNYESTGGNGSGGSASGESGGNSGSGGNGGVVGSGGSGGSAGAGGTGSAGTNGTAGEGASGGSAGFGGGRAGSGGSTTGSGGSTTGSGGSTSGSGGSTTGSGGTPTGGSFGKGSGGSSDTGGATGSGGSSGAKDGGVVRDTGSGPEVARSPDTGKSDSGSSVSYATQIAPLLKASCTSCHGASNAQSGIDLSSYANASKNAKVANSAIQSGSMPPGAAFSTANKQLFQSWVDEGAPNN